MRTAILALSLATCLAPATPASDIVALCIGNDTYVKPEDALDTPVSDATLMRDTLRAIPGVTPGDVVLLPNGTRESMRAALRQFREKARGARLSIVFYSGHGMEDQPTGYDRPETFLLPVDAIIEGADQLPDRAVGLGEVLDVFEGLPPAGRVVILDCCRTGAPSATKAMAGAGKNVAEDLDERVARALGQAELAEGTLVSFSAGPGRKAAAFLKDTDAYSPFTHFLAKGIREQGGDLFGIVSLATATTREATGGKQVPRVKFEGDPSLIAAVRFPAAGGVVAPAPSTESPDLAAMKAELEEAKRKLAAAEAMRKQPVPSSTSAPLPSTQPPTPPTMVKTDPVPAQGAFPADRGMEGTRAGEVREFGGIEMVWCPPGEFLMGSPEDEEGREEQEKQHRVILTNGFWLAKTECSQGDWERILGGNPSLHSGLDLPVESISSVDVRSWLSKSNRVNPLPEGWKWDLPTEAQWEYACRAGTTSPYSGNLEEIAWYHENSDSNSHEVGIKKPNLWGLHDMHGNVWEWCKDSRREYSGNVIVDPVGPRVEVDRCFRGGSWSSPAGYLRCATRFNRSEDRADPDLGFRAAIVKVIKK